jgi:glycosyltransferase involved in cell wall biosynthesis
MLNWRDVMNPEAGGAEIHMHEIGSRWALSGHQVTLLCAGFPNAKRDEILSGVHVHRLGDKYTIYPRVWKYLSGLRSDASHNVVFESINTVPFFSPLVSSVPVVPQIYSIDNKSVLMREVRPRQLPIAIGAYFASSTMATVYRKCEATTISESSKGRLIEEGFQKTRVHVASPGISGELRRILDSVPESVRPNSTIVYLGRLKKYKGVQDLIKAIVPLSKKIPNIRLLIIGKGDYEPELRSLTSSLGLDNNVTFCGFVSEREKASLLKSASLYVCTSADEGGWTISAVEAMAAGVPILVTASQIDLLNEGSNGCLLTMTTPDSISNSVYSMLADQELWRAFSLHARSYSKNFSWDDTARLTLAALKKAVS